MSSTTSSSTSFSLKIRTALSGSPTYLGASNLTVLTRPPFFTSRQGMIRGCSISKLGEVLQQANAPLVALLGMELHAVDVAAAHARDERSVVVGDGKRVLVVARREVVRVEEVEARARAEACEEAVVAARRDVVPAHVRQVGA